MTDPSDDQSPEGAVEPPDAEPAAGEDAVAELRRKVEEEYDFENFGPADMARMSADEWEAAFDPGTWIVGEELLDRVEADLKNRIAQRDVFAVLERATVDGERVLLAYSDEGYAMVYPDGSVEGRGTVLRDVEPTVALCSMDDYDVPDPPETVELPRPEEVPGGTGEFGNLMLQIVAVAQIVAGVGLLVAWVLQVVTTIFAPVAALFFLGVGVFLFTVVANARLSDRFRAEEFRTRLRDVGLESGERPEFVPTPDDARPVQSGDAEWDGSEADPAGGDADEGRSADDADEGRSADDADEGRSADDAPSAN